MIKQIVVVGDNIAGKTELLISYTKGSCPEDPSFGVFDNYFNTITVDEKSVSLSLKDTSGQEDVVHPGSFWNVRTMWWPELMRHCPNSQVILVGTKIELRNNPEEIKRLSESGLKPITYEEGVALAKEIKAEKYIECSARTLANVEQVFDDAIKAAVYGKGYLKSKKNDEKVFTNSALGIITRDNFIETIHGILENHVSNAYKKAMEKYGIDDKTITSLDKDALISFGFPSPFSVEFASFVCLAIKKIIPEEVPENVQGRAIQVQSLPPLWNKVPVNETYLFFNVATLEFQKRQPGVSAADIERYNTVDLMKFFTCMEFKSKIFGKDIFSVFKKEKSGGKGLLNRSYRELVSLKVPIDDARRLRCILMPLCTKAEMENYVVDDTCIWAETLGVSPEALGYLRKNGVTWKRLAEIDDLPGYLRVIDIFEDDNAKIVEAISQLK